MKLNHFCKSCEHSSPLSIVLSTIYSKANRLCFLALRTSWCSDYSSSSAQRSKRICKKTTITKKNNSDMLDNCATQMIQVLTRRIKQWVLPEMGQGKGSYGVWTGVRICYIKKSWRQEGWGEGRVNFPVKKLS